MMTVCVIEMSDESVKLALFKEDRLVRAYQRGCDFDFETHLPPLLQSEEIHHIFIAGIDNCPTLRMEKIAKGMGKTVITLDAKGVKIQDATHQNHPLPLSRSAQALGALKRFPSYNCIIVEITDVIRVDLVTKEGLYCGGALYTGPVPQLLHSPSATGKSILQQKESGTYFGALGAIERIIAQIHQSKEGNHSTKVIATGDHTLIDREDVTEPEFAFYEDLKDLTDLIAPHLALEGLYEIFKEQTKDNAPE